LVSDVTEYAHSSAKFYLCGEQGVYPVLSYLELADIDLRNLSPNDAESVAITQSQQPDIGCEVSVRNSRVGKSVSA